VWSFLVLGFYAVAMFRLTRDPSRKVDLPPPSRLQKLLIHIVSGTPKLLARLAAAPLDLKWTGFLVVTMGFGLDFAAS
jgi:hypothetical protein